MGWTFILNLALHCTEVERSQPPLDWMYPVKRAGVRQTQTADLQTGR